MSPVLGYENGRSTVCNLLRTGPREPQEASPSYLWDHSAGIIIGIFTIFQVLVVGFPMWWEPAISGWHHPFAGRKVGFGRNGHRSHFHEGWEAGKLPAWGFHEYLEVTQGKLWRLGSNTKFERLSRFEDRNLEHLGDVQGFWETFLCCTVEMADAVLDCLMIHDFVPARTKSFASKPRHACVVGTWSGWAFGVPRDVVCSRWLAKIKILSRHVRKCSIKIKQVNVK